MQRSRLELKVVTISEVRWSPLPSRERMSGWWPLRAFAWFSWRGAPLRSQATLIYRDKIDPHRFVADLMQLFPALATVLALSFFFVGCARRADYYINKANKLASSGDYATADLNYRKAIQQ